MKKICLEKMENFSGGGYTNCTALESSAFIAAASGAGLLLFGTGVIFAYGAAIAYVTIYCKGRPFGK